MAELLEQDLNKGSTTDHFQVLGISPDLSDLSNNKVNGYAIMLGDQHMISRL